MPKHEPRVHHLPGDGINPPQRVTLCSCGDRACVKWRYLDDESSQP